MSKKEYLKNLAIGIGAVTAKTAAQEGAKKLVNFIDEKAAKWEKEKPQKIIDYIESSSEKDQAHFFHWVEEVVEKGKNKGKEVTRFHYMMLGSFEAAKTAPV